MAENSNDSDPPAGEEPSQTQHVSARVPEKVGSGSFSTGAIVMTGATEFMIDFVQNIGGPAAVTARVVMPHPVMAQFIEALRKNLEMYTNRFGSPTELPQQPNQPLSPQQIYDDLKIPDDLLSGSYATGVMIGHSAAEFRLDFLTNLFPTAAVSTRVFMSAPQIPRLLQSLVSTYQKYEQIRQQQGETEKGEPLDPPDESIDPSDE
jgi:hypothetical protein